LDFGLEKTMPQQNYDLRTVWRAFFLSINFPPSALIATLVIFLARCGAAGGGSLYVKSAAGDKDFSEKSGYAFPVTKSFTDTTGKITTAASYRVYAANYDLDPKNFSLTLDKPLTGDEQLRVVFSLVGAEGGTDKSPAAAGTYSAKADKFMKVEDVAIVARKNGADSKTLFDRNASSGEVKVSSVTGDTMTGEIGLTSGGNSIKGPFTAKILVRK
jgi:hypothetical protein